MLPIAHPACFASLTEGLIPVDNITMSASTHLFPTTTVSAFSSPEILSRARSRIMLTPTLSRYACTLIAISGSRDLGSIWDNISVTVTSIPSCLRPYPSSRPIAPAPTTTAFSHFSAQLLIFSPSSMVLTLKTPFKLVPSTGGINGDPPVAITK